MLQLVQSLHQAILRVSYQHCELWNQTYRSLGSSDMGDETKSLAHRLMPRVGLLGYPVIQWQLGVGISLTRAQRSRRNIKSQSLALWQK